VEWQRKSDETKGKTEKKEGNIQNETYSKNHREIRKREGKEVKVGYRKITIEVVQWRWNKERVRLEIFK
jgi:hypothetical protein